MSNITYREILLEEFQILKNNKVIRSMNDFAKFLEISASGLSKIFSKKNGLSLEKSKVISKKLNFNNEKSDYFCNLVESEHGRSEYSRDLAKEKVSQYTSKKLFIVRDDVFKTIEKWYHFAILELTCLSYFKSDYKWISTVLNISEVEAENAIKRLLRLNLLEVEDGVFQSTNNDISTEDEIPSESIRLANKEMILKASEAIFTQSIDKRSITSTILTIDKNEIQKAKNEIRKFENKFIKKFSKESNGNDVYCFSLSYFSLLSNK